MAEDTAARWSAWTQPRPAIPVGTLVLPLPARAVTQTTPDGVVGTEGLDSGCSQVVGAHVDHRHGLMTPLGTPSGKTHVPPEAGG
jgi:hypothetical protein